MLWPAVQAAARNVQFIGQGCQGHALGLPAEQFKKCQTAIKGKCHSWSTKMMPLHRNMVRTQCQVLHSHGAVTARHVLTIRCAPMPGKEAQLQLHLADLAVAVSQRPGIVGLHLLRHEMPQMEATTEQKIRGNADRAADWIIVVSGYDLDALRSLDDDELSEARLSAAGAVTQTPCQLYSLAYTAVPEDIR